MQGLRPRLKLWIFKSIVILEFVQNVVFSALASTEAYRPTQYVSYYDMSIGLNQFIISCECFLYAFLYIIAFEFTSYRNVLKEGRCVRGTSLSALLDIINPMDIIRGTIAAFEFLKKPESAGTYGENRVATGNETYGHPGNVQAPVEPKLVPDSSV
jgi:hypothetical protein